MKVSPRDEGQGIERKLPDKALIAFQIQAKSPCCGDEPLQVIYRVYCRILPFVSHPYPGLLRLLAKNPAARLIPAPIVSICLPIALKMNGALSFSFDSRLDSSLSLFSIESLSPRLCHARVSRKIKSSKLCISFCICSNAALNKKSTVTLTVSQDLRLARF